MNNYQIEYTDTFGGEANYCLVKRARVAMPELTAYGYDGGTNYAAANKRYERELMRRAKAAMGLAGIRGRKESLGDSIAFYPYGSATVMFVSWVEE